MTETACGEAVFTSLEAYNQCGSEVKPAGHADPGGVSAVIPTPASSATTPWNSSKKSGGSSGSTAAPKKPALNGSDLGPVGSVAEAAAVLRGSSDATLDAAEPADDGPRGDDDVLPRPPALLKEDPASASPDDDDDVESSADRSSASWEDVDETETSTEAWTTASVVSNGATTASRFGDDADDAGWTAVEHGKKSKPSFRDVLARQPTTTSRAAASAPAACSRAAPVKPRPRPKPKQVDHDDDDPAAWDLDHFATGTVGEADLAYARRSRRSRQSSMSRARRLVQKAETRQRQGLAA